MDDAVAPRDEEVDVLRATSFKEFFGQEKLVDRLRVMCSAALQARKPLDHVFLNGPAGNGKTTLAKIIAAELDEPFYIQNMPTEPKALERILKQMDRTSGGILMLDEIHAATKAQKDMLLPLLEFGILYTSTGRPFEVPWLTVIAATTEPKEIGAPLLDRFPIRPRFIPYTDHEMQQIAESMARKIGLTMSSEGCLLLGRAAGGVPRQVSTFMKNGLAMSIDFDRDVAAEEILEFTDVAHDGLTLDHIEYLHALSDLDGQAGLELVSTIMRSHPAIVKRIEEFLFQRGYVAYGPRGRELTQDGYRRMRETRDDTTPANHGGQAKQTGRP